MRRGRPDPDGGETVVRAVVHARLLGLRILSLDARVVVGRPTIPLGDVAPATDLSRAVELLANGTETLERSRRLTSATRA